VSRPLRARVSPPAGGATSIANEAAPVISETDGAGQP
jgi:hypothetical protein